MSTSIYLGNLSWNMDEAGLRDSISQYAHPTSVEIKRNKMGKSLGYAIATFESSDDGRAVVEGMHGTEVDGREVNAREDRGAKPARTTGSKPSGGGGSGGGRSSAPRSSAPRAAQASSGSTSRVFVGNLSWDTNDEALMGIFEEFNIVSASVQRHPNGSSKGWALAEFGTAKDAAAAIDQMTGAEVDGREIICREDRGPPGRSGGDGGGSGGGGGGGGGRSRGPRNGGGSGGGDGGNKRAPRERRVIEEGAPSTSVFIGNLSWSMNDLALDELLQGFAVTEASVQTRPDGKSRGFALVRFDTVEEAQRAINDLNGQDVMDRQLLLKFDARGGQ